MKKLQLTKYPDVKSGPRLPTENQKVRRGELQTPSRNAGQVMLLTTLVLSGTILAAVTIAGLLMVYQIRQAGNAENSARAIFAADTGLDFQVYRLVQGRSPTVPSDPCAETISAFTITPKPEAISRLEIRGPDAMIISNGLASNAYRLVNWTYHGGATLPGAACASAAP